MDLDQADVADKTACLDKAGDIDQADVADGSDSSARPQGRRR